jgi:hypothetical protein
MVCAYVEQEHESRKWPRECRVCAGSQKKLTHARIFICFGVYKTFSAGDGRGGPEQCARSLDTVHTVGHVDQAAEQAGAVTGSLQGRQGCCSFEPPDRDGPGRSSVLPSRLQHSCSISQRICELQTSPLAVNRRRRPLGEMDFDSELHGDDGDGTQEGGASSPPRDQVKVFAFQEMSTHKVP